MIIAELRLLADDWVREQQIRRAKESFTIKRREQHTDDWLAILFDFKRTLAISDQERKIEQVLDGLCKIVRVGDKPEKVHRAILLHE